MSNAPYLSIFKGVSAIDDAGGIDGFVREVLAESKRLALRTVHTQGPVDGVEGAKILLAETMTSVVFRRLDSDLQRGFQDRLGCAILGCADGDLEAAARRAQADAESWSAELLDKVMEAIHGKGADAAHIEEPTT